MLWSKSYYYLRLKVIEADKIVDKMVEEWIKRMTNIKLRLTLKYYNFTVVCYGFSL